MDYRNELLNLLKYCSDSANFITKDDSTEDKYAKSAYMDVISKIGEIFEREKVSSHESAALPLHVVSQQRELLLAFCKWSGENTPTQSVLKPKQLVDSFLKANNCG